ncbi:MAG TPA: bifunctional nicotinamidase/pyrazinamidase [Desulfuromonadales bacterium]|nr:bifunctional nicotinamidase/pyrazinamidase [Desulfuromonadales bacterium]
MNKSAALLIVDVQNDFCPGGTLEVPCGDRVVEPLNRVTAACAAAGLPVLASRDWHPAVTRHFNGFGGIWPCHCVQNSSGADFHPALQLPKGMIIISKGNEPDSDSYSAFDGRSEEGRPLGGILQDLEVGQLYIGGLATDYCVRASVLDAKKAGFDVTLLTDAIAGVDISAGDSEKALEEMGRAGVRFCTSHEAVRQITGNPA